MVTTTLAMVRVLPNEIQVISPEPGRAPFVFTRTEAVKLAECLNVVLSIAAPRLLRPTLWRRFVDGILRWRTSQQRIADLQRVERVKRLMQAGETKSVVYK